VITIYLDSSDYSAMSEPGNLSAQAVRARLKQHVADRKIEIRFSFVHVVECAHLDNASRPMALRRMETIGELSGGKCFLWWPDLVESESVRVAKGQSLIPPDYALSDDGRWHPSVTAIASGLRATLVNGLKKAIKDAPLSRPQRRQLFRSLMDNGRLTPAAISLLRPGREELLRDLATKLPISRRFLDDDLLLKFAVGEVSATEITSELQKSFADLSVFVGWAYDQFDQNRKLTSWLRGYGADLIAKTESLRQKITDFAESSAASGKSAKEINQAVMRKVARNRKVRDDTLWKAFEDKTKLLAKQGITKSIWQSRIIDSEIGAIPSLDSLYTAMSLYLRRNAAFSTNARGLLDSDAGDLYHMCYLPYVDIFRCDKYAGEIASEISQRRGSRVVRKLSDLLPAIESWGRPAQ
jgi:hypothetical protein